MKILFLVFSHKQFRERKVRSRSGEHQNNTKTFEELDFQEQSKSITAQINNLKAAVEANIRRAQDEGRDELSVKRKRYNQIFRMLEKLL